MAGPRTRADWTRMENDPSYNPITPGAPGAGAGAWKYSWPQAYSVEDALIDAELDRYIQEQQRARSACLGTATDKELQGVISYEGSTTPSRSR